MSKNFEIRLITPDELDLYMDCAEIVIADNGRNETPIFCAYESPAEWDRTKRTPKFKVNMQKKSTEPGWQRMWGIFGSDGKIHGDIGLWTAESKSTAHRATLGMSMKKEIRGQGFGSLLMQTAIDWAKKEPHLAYIDLQVLGGNDPAVALYEKFGFEKNGYWDDRLRLFGKQVAEYSYSLALEKVR